MNILLVTSEAVPFAKTGGLGDVCGALPAELSRQGHQVALILPAYAQARACRQPMAPAGIDLAITIGSKTVRGRLLESRLPESDVTVYLVEQDEYFGRPDIYGPDGKDYPDNCERFVFFCRSVMEAVRLLGLRPDVLHANDWQTGLVPAYLKLEYGAVPGFEQAACLFTIHNLAYQGQFWHWDMLLTGLDWKHFNWREMEFYGHLNLMKTALVFADAINTVSPRYAEEIQSAPLGCGLEGVLAHRRDALSGIINGVDYRRWDPAVDPHLPRNYDAATAALGKAACKAAVEQELGLEPLPRTPLAAFIGRLVDQKGVDLLADLLRAGEGPDVQWAILGTGEVKHQRALAQVAERLPRRVALRLEFSEPLAHRLQGAADLLVMPSRYEPCGLNQLYALKYGTVPVARATGGLVDTITDASDAALAAGAATGFHVPEHTPRSLRLTLERARRIYDDEATWARLVRRGMAQDWSWRRSAEEYARLYQRVLAGKRPTAAGARA